MRHGTFTDAAGGDDEPADAAVEPDAIDESGPITVTTFNHDCFDLPTAASAASTSR